MPNYLFVIGLLGLMGLCNVANAFEPIDTRQLTLVEENHASIEKDGISYTLDSYIILFQRPYYITVKRNDNKPLSLKAVEQLAVEYIKPRGCTSPVVRRPDLDRKNNNQTQWLIGVEC